MRKNILLIFLVSFFLCVQGFSQYNMGNFTVSDCEGTLKDSEVGNADRPTGYDHNENFTFTVCVPNASSVTITFNFFELEKPSSGSVSLDILSIYQGPDKNGTLIGQYTGDNSPGTITINDSCFTIHFVSDASVNAEGWDMSWIFVPPQPDAPDILPIPNVNCYSTDLVIQFEEGIACSQVNPNNFNLSNNPAGASIVDAIPLNCTNDTTSFVQLVFGDSLDESGTYTVSYNLVYFDICDNPFLFTDSTTFSILDCPLEVEIIGDTTFCEGGCTDIYADVQGGDFTNYQYTWQPSGPNAALNTVCPTDSLTQYIVTVTDGNSIPVSDTITVVRYPNPTLGPDFSICRYSPDTFLTATPAGGQWYGNGMNTQGRFRSNVAPGVHTVTYVAPNGCSSTLDITVHDIVTPYQVAVCASADSVLIYSRPTGGTWSGDPNITPDGYYKPSPNNKGSFTVTYTEPINGCTKTTIIHVEDSINIPVIDSITKCTNEPAFNLPTYPAGGSWSGNGVNNGGNFNPGAAGTGYHVLYYSLPGGCIDSTSVEVFDIYAGPDTILCPGTPNLILNSGLPANGIWSGQNVNANADSSVYTLNVSAFGTNDGFVDLTYAIANCSDVKRVYFITTQVPDTTFSFCEYDTLVRVPTSTLAVNPNGGIWYGNNFASDTMDITNHGPGTEYVYYEYGSNGCIDSIEVVINGKPIASTPAVTDTVCPREVDFNLIGSPAGGIWSGIGITDPIQGTFSPTSIGFSGVFESFYTINGCTDTTDVVVRIPNLSITGLGAVYCFQYGNLINIDGAPNPGYFEGPGIIDPNAATFDPSVAGEGTHDIVYVYGTGACIYTDTAVVTVQPPLSIDSIVGDSIICFGDQARIRAFVTGGRGAQNTYELNWNPTIDGGFSPFNVRVAPENTTTYTLTARDEVYDYCGYIVQEDFTVTVNPEILYSSVSGPPVCYGDSNDITLSDLSANPVDFVWKFRNGDSLVSPYLKAPAGLYDLDVVDQITGCRISTREDLPQFPYLEAEILKIPGKECLSILDPTIYVINSSVGADGGSWIIQDIDTLISVPYTPGENFEFHFPDTGDYTISLVVYNGGGQCSDSISSFQCIEKIVKVFIPNAFSPNGDGDNEIWPTGTINKYGNFIPQGYDLIDFEYIVFDRWGKEVFNSEVLPNVSWNGNHFNREGIPCKPGVYTYAAKIVFDEFNIQKKRGIVTLLR